MDDARQRAGGAGVAELGHARGAMPARDHDAAPGPGRRVPFAELVHLHHRWRAGLDDSDAEQQRRAEQYYAARAAFEEEHGRIVNAYWCWEVESAVALTERSRRFLARLRRGPDGDPVSFHRVSDWATKSEPEVARCLHQCDELAIRASEVLGGRNRRICMALAMACAGHLLSLVDTRGAPESAGERRRTLDVEREEIAEAHRYYRSAANGEAQLVYFAGIVLGLVVLLPIFALLGSSQDIKGVSESELVGCFVAGALGAVVSVIARINSGTFMLDFDVAKGYTLFLGALRPLIGAVFALAIYFAVTGDFIDIFAVPGQDDDVKRFYFLCVIAFLAGFSERWAQDTLTGGLVGRGRKPKEGPPVPRRPPASAPSPPSGGPDIGS